MTTDNPEPTPADNPEPGKPLFEPRYQDAQIVDYMLSMMLNENMTIPAQNCAIHTAAVDWLNDLKGGF